MNSVHPLLANSGESRVTQTWHGSASSPVNTWANTISIIAAHSRNQTLRSRPADQVNRDIERQVKNILLRRQLLLLLVASEVERIDAWLNPLVEQPTDDKNVIDRWMKGTFGETRSDAKFMRNMTKFAWEISTQMAVYLAARFRSYSAVRTTLQDLIRTYPEHVSHLPDALPFFLGDISTNYDAFDVCGHFVIFLNALFFQLLDDTLIHLGTMFARCGFVAAITSFVRPTSHYNAVCGPGTSIISR